MTYSDLTTREQWFFNRMKEAEATNAPIFIAVAAILYAGTGQPPIPFEDTYSRGDFKRAIKRLRVFQQNKPQCAGIYEEAIAFIRRNWLHREEAAV